MKFKINIVVLLEYFDLKESTNYGDTTATISVVGEDLCAAIFKHYCENIRHSKIEIIDSNDEIPTTLKRIGPRLDRWIIEQSHHQSVLYQTEIKNWCARAVGGMNFPISISRQQINVLAEKNWSRDLERINEKKLNGLNKVFFNMVSQRNLPGTHSRLKREPLLIFWDCRKPLKEKSFFFRYRTSTKYHHFSYCWFFSCSLYLRQLMQNKVRRISVEMPNVERRLLQLNAIFKT